MMQPPAAGQRVGRSRRVGVAALIAVGALGVLFAVSVAMRARRGSEQHAFTYSVTGTGTSASVIYLMPSTPGVAASERQRHAIVTLPWTISSRTRVGESLSLTASTGDTSPVECVVSVDGQVVQTRSGPSCSVGVTP